MGIDKFLVKIRIGKIHLRKFLTENLNKISNFPEFKAESIGCCFFRIRENFKIVAPAGIFGDRVPTRKVLLGGSRLGSGAEPPDAGEVFKNIQIKSIEITILLHSVSVFVFGNFNESFAF